MVSPGVNRPASYKLVGAILVASTRIKQRGRLTRAPAPGLRGSAANSS